MRRSAAPSQLRQATKRPRFTPPVAASEPKKSAQDVLKLIQGIQPQQNTEATENKNHAESKIRIFEKEEIQTSPSTPVKEVYNDCALEGMIDNRISTKWTNNKENDSTVSNDSHASPEKDDTAINTATKYAKFDNKESEVKNDLKDSGSQSKSVHKSKYQNILKTEQSMLKDSPENIESEFDIESNNSKQNVVSEPMTKSGTPTHKPIFSTGFKPPKTNVGKFTAPRLKPFKTPTPGTMQSVGTSSLSGASSQSCAQASSTDSSIVSHYYNVMWCKNSKKKHKKWEGDAVLITKGRGVSIVDMEGKEIGRGSGYKSAELSSLVEGSSLVIGGKEIEVMSSMSEQEYHSGRCFQAAAPPPSSPTQQKLNSGISKPFMKPQKGSTKSDNNIPVTPDIPIPVNKPRFDPTAPDALVLPRPPHHKSGAGSIIDVVVDPYLCQHLRPHQRQGIHFLYSCCMSMKPYAGCGAILADEMGLGKTLQCISLIWTLLKQGPYNGKPIARKVLVVTPGSLVKNWSKEFRKWLGTERIRVFTVGTDSRVAEFVNSPMHPVMIVSYEMLVRCIDDVRAVNFDLIVCDEGHRLKNAAIKTTAYLSSLPCRRRVVLTGTPVQNDLQELFSIVDFCNPGILGTSGTFKRVYEDAIIASRQPGASAEQQVLGQTRAAELNRITQMFILRRTSEINNAYLPPKVELVLFCRPSPLQSRLYRQLVTSRLVRSLLACSDPAQHLMCIAALKKLCNHPCLIHKQAMDVQNDFYKDLAPVFGDDYTSEVEHSGKLLVLDELLSNMYSTTPRQRVVLVSNYTQTLDVLEELCRAREYGFLRLDGQTPTGKRQQLVDRFNNKHGNDFVFLLSSKAGGVGLNLVGAARLVLYDIDWNPANDLQSMARVWRDGQRAPTVFVYRLLTTGTIEEKVYQRQITKQGLSGVVVDAKTTNAKLCFSPEELRNLFTLDEDSLCSTHDLLQCDCAENSDVSKETGILPAKPVSSRNLNMSELLEWHHVPGPSPHLATVDACAQDLNNVSFVFWNENNAPTAAAQELMD